MWVISKSGISGDRGSSRSPGATLTPDVEPDVEPEFEPDFDLGAVVSELHDVPRAEVDGAVDASAVDERAVSAPEVNEHEPDPAVIARDDPCMVPTHVGVACGVESDRRRQCSAEDQLAVRAERDDVDLGRPCATQVSNDEAYHISESAKRATCGSRPRGRQRPDRNSAAWSGRPHAS